VSSCPADSVSLPHVSPQRTCDAWSGRSRGRYNEIVDESRFTELVLAAARRLDLVDGFGRLLPLDSIQSLEAISTLLSSLQT